MSNQTPTPPYRPQLGPASTSGITGPGLLGSYSNPWAVPAHKLTEEERAFLAYMRLHQTPQPAPEPAPVLDLPPHIRPWP